MDCSADPHKVPPLSPACLQWRIGRWQGWRLSSSSLFVVLLYLQQCSDRHRPFVSRTVTSRRCNWRILTIGGRWRWSVLWVVEWTGGRQESWSALWVGNSPTMIIKFINKILSIDHKFDKKDCRQSCIEDWSSFPWWLPIHSW